jgi:hypothetical protein
MAGGRAGMWALEASVQALTAKARGQVSTMEWVRGIGVDSRGPRPGVNVVGVGVDIDSKSPWPGIVWGISDPWPGINGVGMGLGFDSRSLEVWALMSSVWLLTTGSGGHGWGAAAVARS